MRKRDLSCASITLIWTITIREKGEIFVAGMGKISLFRCMVNPTISDGEKMCIMGVVGIREAVGMVMRLREIFKGITEFRLFYFCIDIIG